VAYKKHTDVPVSSFIKKLAAAQNEGPAFLTRGYVGEVNDNVVRLYFDLSLATYAEIPRSAVLHTQPIKDDPHERSELMVAAEQDINLVHRVQRTVTPDDIRKAEVEGLNEIMQLKAPPKSKDPCAKPEAKADCADRDAGSPAKLAGPAKAEENQRDPLRRAGRIALGPLGFLLDL
jgi:hypothetical protein